MSSYQSSFTADGLFAEPDRCTYVMYLLDGHSSTTTMDFVLTARDESNVRQFATRMWGPAAGNQFHKVDGLNPVTTLLYVSIGLSLPGGTRAAVLFGPGGHHGHFPTSATQQSIARFS
ncbi:unnamed protein product [Calypogeia fissa]